MADNDELMQVLQYVTSGFGGFIERNGAVSKISQEPVSIQQMVRDDKGDVVGVDSGELTLPSILHAFKQSYLLERLPIPEELVDTVYLNEYSSMSQVGLFSFEDRQWSLSYKLPESKTKSQSLMLYKYPDWATHIIQHKTNKDLRRCVKLNGEEMIGGYQFGENDFSLEYLSQEWEVLYPIAEEIARFEKGELEVQTA